MTRRMWFLLVLLGFVTVTLNAQTIVELRVRGNAKVETDAILMTLKTKKGDKFNITSIRQNITALYGLGYFADIKIFKKELPSGELRLIVEVKEKPAIMEIKFEGFDEVTEEDLKDKLQTKQYTIVNEAVITKDLFIIEKQYLEKGYYLAKASYTLNKREGKDHEVTLTYHVDEGGKVQVGSIYILGNKFFSKSEIIEKFMSKPITRSSYFATPGSVYHDDLIQRDLEVLSYLYKDYGFAEVKVAKPIKVMDPDRQFVRITMEVEEGIQYNVGSIDVSGDLLYEKQELFNWMELKENELFRFSRFRKDVEMLIDKYGDKGYAFVDVNPVHRFDREKKLVHLNYKITKGEKVYFGEITVVGNTKTRDNVIRREFKVADSELYSGTRLTQSKKNIERLGFFEEVQSIRSRDKKMKNVLNYKFKVKEKPTGQLQAAIGFSPGGSTESQWFGQGSYKEANQSGTGINVHLTGRWNAGKTYSLEIGATNPRVNDSLWSLGCSGFLNNDVTTIAKGVYIQERRVGGSITIGRHIIENIRGSVTYKLSKITQNSDVFILDRFREEGIASSIVAGVTRNTTNNYLDPSSGSKIGLYQTFSGGSILGGQRQYTETQLSASYYYPIDFTESYRTYFRVYGLFGLLGRLNNEPIPFANRYRLGGAMNLRGFDYRSIGPKYYIMQTPEEGSLSVNNGGTKKLLFQLEYFFPIIAQANIKGLLFADAGRVYNDEENVEFSDFKRDFGFGFRWITPIAPFRFEWAYPIEDGEVGDAEFIFYLGF